MDTRRGWQVGLEVAPLPDRTHLPDTFVRHGQHGRRRGQRARGRAAGRYMARRRSVVGDRAVAGVEAGAAGPARCGSGGPLRWADGHSSAHWSRCLRHSKDQRGVGPAHPTLTDRVRQTASCVVDGVDERGCSGACPLQLTEEPANVLCGNSESLPRDVVQLEADSDNPPSLIYEGGTGRAWSGVQLRNAHEAVLVVTSYFSAV
jgi:hypothetical protein